MTLIDHQILIPASQSKVWTTISDLQQNPLWQANCKGVSILTTMKSGQGTRWRSTTKSGREQVLEITAWYDRLGYEYRIVDGSPLQNNKGLFRLQEIPEGTIVQWTFSYDPTGLLSNLRNSLRTRRQLDHEIIDSLRQLYRLNSSRQNAGNINIETKSLMRAAPDVESRAQYRPRHPSNIEQVGAGVQRPSDATYRMNRNIARPSAESQPVPTGISEPAVEEGDTRPNVVMAQVTQPTQPADTDAPYRPPAVPVQEETSLPSQPEPVPAASEIAPLETTSSTTEAERPTSETQSVSTYAPQTEAPITTPPASEEPVLERFDSEFSSQIDTRELDTAKISVFELFGIPKPSDSEPIQPIGRPEPAQLSESSEMISAVTEEPVDIISAPREVATLPSTPTATIAQPVKLDPDFMATLHSEPVGLRWLLRRKTVNIRRPAAKK
jgi:hypothetical protein